MSEPVKLGCSVATVRRPRGTDARQVRRARGRAAAAIVITTEISINAMIIENGTATTIMTSLTEPTPPTAITAPVIAAMTRAHMIEWIGVSD